LNWGYFYDHDPNAYHCNAHPNNLVCVAPEYGLDYLAAPIDFDMAFTEDEFINIDVNDSKTYG
jgi:hypothetical protein